jgi:hypothetical protein
MSRQHQWFSDISQSANAREEKRAQFQQDSLHKNHARNPQVIQKLSTGN